MRIEAILASIAISAGLAGGDADFGRPSLSDREAAMTFRGEILGPLLVESMLEYIDARTRPRAPVEDAPSRRALHHSYDYDGGLTLAEHVAERAQGRRTERGGDERDPSADPDPKRSAEASLELIEMMKRAREAKEKRAEK